MTNYCSSLLPIDEDTHHEIKNLQLESNRDLYRFSNIIYDAVYGDIWRIINISKKITDTVIFVCY
jgi:hypothetical protein